MLPCNRYIRWDKKRAEIRKMERFFAPAYSLRGIILNLRRRDIAGLPTP
jgi:hypothetical protein